MVQSLKHFVFVKPVSSLFWSLFSLAPIVLFSALQQLSSWTPSLEISQHLHKNEPDLPSFLRCHRFPLMLVFVDTKRLTYFRRMRTDSHNPTNVQHFHISPTGMLERCLRRLRTPILLSLHLPVYIGLSQGARLPSSPKFEPVRLRLEVGSLRFRISRPSPH